MPESVGPPTAPAHLARAAAVVRSVGVPVCSALSVAAAAHVAANRRHLAHLRADRAGADDIGERVSVLVPARDEAATIAACVAGLRAQQGVADLRILILDDSSGDGTADLAEAAAGNDPRVTVLRPGDDPPPGWLGKPYACQRLADAADGSVLLFVDADVRLGPHAVAAAVAELRRSGAALLSAWPRQLAASPLARLVQPLQQWSWLATVPLRVARRGGPASLTAANGQFLLVAATAYRRAGGHAAIRGEVLDDIHLARTFRRAGLSVDVADASQVARCLMYADDREVVDGYAKSLWSAFGGPGRGMAVAGLLAAGFVVPPAYALLGRQPALRLVALGGYASGVVSRVLAARATGSRAWPDALAHPASVSAFAALMARSVAGRRRGTLRWRGRPV